MVILDEAPPWRSFSALYTHHLARHQPTLRKTASQNTSYYCCFTYNTQPYSTQHILIQYLWIEHLRTRCLLYCRYVFLRRYYSTVNVPAAYQYYGNNGPWYCVSGLQ